MPAQTEVKFDPFFGGFILETLTVGMYGEARNAIREYVQNGFDSIMRARELKLLAPGSGAIKIIMSTDKKSLVIRDDGAGLSVKAAAQTLTRIGASSKSHSRNAGFRGIGRLAGIVFCDKLTFITKAKGEKQQTVVVFDARAMREAISPGKGSLASAEDVMNTTVKAYIRPDAKVADHFFEVHLEGLRDAPSECTSPRAMKAFLSQVSPVPYPASFPYRDILLATARSTDIPIDEVTITVAVGAGAGEPIFKRYGKSYEFNGGEVELSDCKIEVSPTKRWWAWVGEKAESGAYTDEKVRGLRIRVRNIQIDGTEIVREIFRDFATSSQARFQDYFLGEIFIKPTALIPNARRDGFEEDNAWRSVRKEVGAVTKTLAKQAYDVSTAGRLSLGAQQDALKKVKTDFRALKKGGFANVDKAVALTRSITTYQQRIAKATEAADLETSAKLTAIGSEYADLKLEVLKHVGGAAVELDRERVESDARDQLISEIMNLLDEQLSPKCLREVKEILSDYIEE